MLIESIEAVPGSLFVVYVFHQSALATTCLPRYPVETLASLEPLNEAGRLVAEDPLECSHMGFLNLLMALIDGGKADPFEDRCGFIDELRCLVKVEVFKTYPFGYPVPPSSLVNSRS